MSRMYLLVGAVLVLPLGGLGSSSATALPLPTGSALSQQVGESGLVGKVRRGGGGHHVARGGRGHAVRRSSTVRRTNVHRGADVRVNRRTNVRVNNHRANVARRHVRPVRPWVRRPYYGRVVAGVALGSIIVATAGVVPAAPGPNLCWYWSNSSMTRGYWDYCSTP